MRTLYDCWERGLKPSVAEPKLERASRKRERIKKTDAPKKKIRQTRDSKNQTEGPEGKRK